MMMFVIEQPDHTPLGGSVLAFDVPVPVHRAGTSWSTGSVHEHDDPFVVGDGQVGLAVAVQIAVRD